MPIADLTGTAWRFNSTLNNTAVNYSINGKVYSPNYTPYTFEYIDYDTSYGVPILSFYYNDIPSPYELGDGFIYIPQNQLGFDEGWYFGNTSDVSSYVTVEAPTILIDGGTDTESSAVMSFLENNAEEIPSFTFDLTTLANYDTIFPDGGDYTITIKAEAAGYLDSIISNSETYSAPYVLDAPTNVAISGTEVTFDKVDDAEQYEFYVDDVSIGSYTVLPSPKPSLSDYTWAEIKVLADAVANNDISSSDLSNTYNISIGDTKASIINSEGHNYRLIGINHDVDADNNTIGMTFKQVDLMADYYVMKSSMTSTASWQNSNLKTTLEGFAVASDLAAVITPAKKVCAKNVSSGTPTYNYINSTNGLWIESETEVFGTQTYTKGGTVEGGQYEWYINGGSTIMQRSGSSAWWWLRSPYIWHNYEGESCFAIIDRDGDVNIYNSDFAFCVAPCFCI